MNSTLTIIVGAAAALVLAVMAANALRPADGSFAGGPDLALERRTRSDDVAAAMVPQRDGRQPDYVVGTDSLARDRLAWQGAEAAAQSRDAPPAAIEPAPDTQQSLPAEPAEAAPADPAQ